MMAELNRVLAGVLGLCFCLAASPGTIAGHQPAARDFPPEGFQETSETAPLPGLSADAWGRIVEQIHKAQYDLIRTERTDVEQSCATWVAPNRAHGLNDPYFVRRRWDFFVRHLLGVEPPAGYEIKRPEG